MNVYCDIPNQNMFLNYNLFAKTSNLSTSHSKNIHRLHNTETNFHLLMNKDREIKLHFHKCIMINVY